MIITDIIECSNCNNDIEWYYQIPQRITSRGILDVDKIPNDKARAYHCIHIEDSDYSLTCRCTKCDAENTFRYTSEYKLHLN